MGWVGEAYLSVQSNVWVDTLQVYVTVSVPSEWWCVCVSLVCCPMHISEWTDVSDRVCVCGVEWVRVAEYMLVTMVTHTHSLSLSLHTLFYLLYPCLCVCACVPVTLVSHFVTASTSTDVNASGCMVWGGYYRVIVIPLVSIIYICDEMHDTIQSNKIQTMTTTIYENEMAIKIIQPTSPLTPIPYSTPPKKFHSRFVIIPGVYPISTMHDSSHSISIPLTPFHLHLHTHVCSANKVIFAPLGGRLRLRRVCVVDLISASATGVRVWRWHSDTSVVQGWWLPGLIFLLTRACMHPHLEFILKGI